MPFGLGSESAAVSLGGEVEQGPEFAEPVEGVQAGWVVLPAGREGSGELAVAGVVDLFDPGVEPV